LTRTYAEQEQIYKGFIKLVQLQRKLLVARKELAAKLKGSVDKPLLIIKNNNDIKQPQLTQDKRNQLNKESELLLPQPQLPKTINTIEEEKTKKSKPQIKIAANKDLNIEVTRDEELPAMSSSLSSNAAAESPSTEIPATEIYSIKREGERKGISIEKRKLVKEGSSRNKNN
jgi:hypothetical protein